MEDLQRERENTLRAIQPVSVSAETSRELSENVGDRLDMESRNELLTLKNRIDKRNWRRAWNNVLATLVIIGFFFSLSVTLLIGTGYLVFDKFAVPTVIAAGVLETYGLSKLAVSYIFSDDKIPKKKR